MSTDEKEKDEVFQKWIEAAMRKEDQTQWFLGESDVMCSVIEEPKNACFKRFEKEQRKNRKQRRQNWRNIRELEIRYMPIDLSNTTGNDDDLSDNDSTK